MKLNFIESLFEGATNIRIPHPEDAIFDGSADAKKYSDALLEIIRDPGKITIKWDGGVALYFGRKPNGEFFCSDKYMYGKGKLATNIEQWIEHDKTKRSGTLRPDLYNKLRLIWMGLEQSVGRTKGVFMSDLMHTGKLKPVGGVFKFRPTTVEYHVPVDSDLGKLIAGKLGVVVVHKFNDTPWDGVTGLTNSGSVAIIAPTAGNKFTLNSPVQLVNAAEKAVDQMGPVADKFLNGLDNTACGLIKTYMNKQITQQTNDDIYTWIQQNASGKQYKLLVGDNSGGYLHRNVAGLNAVFSIWNCIYRLKENLCQQLEPQVRGFEQWTGGQRAGEGFVCDTGIGLVKLVNRGLFGVEHFN
jgi:hypothetical protein